MRGSICNILLYPVYFLKLSCDRAKDFAGGNLTQHILTITLRRNLFLPAFFSSI